MLKLLNATLFNDQSIYHVFNKTLDHKEIFSDPYYAQILLNTLDYYNITTHKISYSSFLKLTEKQRSKYLLFSGNMGERLIDNYSLCLLPNHYHLLCKENFMGNLPKYMSNVFNSFTRFYNLKNNREGAIFKRGFKKVTVTNEQQFLHLLRYVNVNCVSCGLIKFKDLINYDYCSYKLINNGVNNNICLSSKVLELFKDLDDFNGFIADSVDYQKSLYLIKQGLKELGIKNEMALYSPY